MNDLLYETERLIVRRWRAEDRAPLRAMSADPEVMRFFPSTLTPEESDALFDRLQAAEARNGFTFPVVERRTAPGFIGFVGLSRAEFPAAFTPAVEIGWRLARPHWGQGYAKEAARAALKFGFERLDLDEIVSFTAIVNTPSQAVMRGIGMTRDQQGDFRHPNTPPGSTLTPHALYRITRQAWARA